jgi:autotransporter-associated beta strand protein
MKPRYNRFLRRSLAIAALVGFGVAQSIYAASVTWNVAGNGTWDASTGNWSGGSPTANLYVNGDTANFTNTAGGSITLSGTIAPLATNVSAASGTYTFTGTGITSGTLTKTNAGTLILQNSNSHAGLTTVRGNLTINSGGAITGGGGLTIGGSATPTGTVQYDSAATSTFGAITVGAGNDGSGNSTLNQTAGTINASSLTLNNAYTGLGAGDINLSGTAILAISGTTIVSNQVANDNTYSTITVGSGTSFSSGSINMTAAPGTGRNAAGRITQNGGSVTTGTLNMAQSTSGNTAPRRGEYNLNGGTLNVSSITQGAGTDTFGTFNFDGGTLKPTANSTTFMQGLTTANVKAGGAKIDTGVYDITIGQALVADSAAGGLVKDGAGTLTLSNVSTYTGDTLVNNGTLALSSTGGLNFKIGLDGVNNQINGAGTVSLDGLFTFDLTSASTTIDDSWNIVNVATLIESFGSNFSIDSFTRNGGGTGAGIWTKVIDLDSRYLFNTSSGVLTVIPEPSAALLGGLGMLALLRRRRA